MTSVELLQPHTLSLWNVSSRADNVPEVRLMVMLDTSSPCLDSLIDWRRVDHTRLGQRYDRFDPLEIDISIGNLPRGECSMKHSSNRGRKDTEKRTSGL